MGLFDPAKAWFGIEHQVAHIDDTLRSYDIAYGTYIVFPLLGSSDLRNGFSTIVESMASPLHQITNDPQTLYLQTYGGFHNVAPQLLSYEELRKDKSEPYVFFRNLYMQGLLRDRQFPIKEVEEPQGSKEQDTEEGESAQGQDSSEQP